MPLRKLHVVREEVRDQTINATSVVEHTKTNRNRFVPLVPKAIELFGKIDHVSDYTSSVSFYAFAISVSKSMSLSIRASSLATLITSTLPIDVSGNSFLNRISIAPSLSPNK